MKLLQDKGEPVCIKKIEIMEIQKIALTGLMSGQLYLETMTELKDYDICNRELNQRIGNTAKLMERTIG